MFILAEVAKGSALAEHKTNHATFRRIRRLEFGVVSRLSFESLTFFGAVAVLVGAAFNIGLLAEFGLSFISLLAVDELVMTSFGLLIFLVPFYTLALALLSQLYLVRNISRVLAQRGSSQRLVHARRRSVVVALLELGLVIALVSTFAMYRSASIGAAKLATLLLLLTVSVVVLAFVGTGNERSRLWLAGLQLAAMCVASAYFGATVASVRQNRISEIVLEGTAVKGGIVLMSKSGVFVRTVPEAGLRKSVFIPASSIRRVID